MTKAPYGHFVQDAHTLDPLTLSAILRDFEQDAHKVRAAQQLAVQEKVKLSRLATKENRTPEEEAEYFKLRSSTLAEEEKQLKEKQLASRGEMIQKYTLYLGHLKSVFRSYAYANPEEAARLKLEGRGYHNAAYTLAYMKTVEESDFKEAVFNNLEIPLWAKFKQGPNCDHGFTYYFAMTEENRLEWVAQNPYIKPAMDMPLALLNVDSLTNGQSNT